MAVGKTDEQKLRIAQLEDEIAQLRLNEEQLLKQVIDKNVETSDMTEALRLAEKRLWDAIAVLPDGFALFDEAQMFVAANEAYNDIYTPIRQHLTKGTSRFEILRAAVECGLIDIQDQSMDQFLSERRKTWDQNKFVERVVSMGEDRWVRLTERRTASGDVIASRVDVTAEKQREFELQQARYNAEAASRAKSAFLANMSHEIRTPMNGVIGMADLLNETKLTQEQNVFTRTIKNSGEALLVIINDILDYSKIEADQMELFPDPFNLEECIHEVSMLLESKACEKGLDLLVDYDMFTPEHFIGDSGRIRQVMLNLMGNAIKFTETGHVLVRVIGVEEDAGQALHISVEDTGIGIPEDKIAHVFGEFKQIDEEENRKYEGTGLGLAISKRLIEIMGGEMWLDSVYGEGSVFGFKIILPAHEKSEAALPTMATSVSRAMIVDDVEANLIILQKQLGHLGINVDCFENGLDALEHYKTDQNYDLIITDHHMSKMLGPELAKHLRNEGYKGTLIAMSSQSALSQVMADRTLFDASFQKPTLRRDLYKSLNAVYETEEVSPYLDENIAQPQSSERRMLNVILAEDNKTNQLVFKKMLKDANVNLRIAANGSELVEMSASRPPDLIFTDISMPEMDGMEATEIIRSREAGEKSHHIPIVALTAHAMPGDREKFMKVGMDDYLTKPLKKGVVLEMLEKMAELALARQQQLASGCYANANQ